MLHFLSVALHIRMIHAVLMHFGKHKHIMFNLPGFSVVNVYLVDINVCMCLSE